MASHIDIERLSGVAFVPVRGFLQSVEDCYETHCGRCGKYGEGSTPEEADAALDGLECIAG